MPMRSPRGAANSSFARPLHTKLRTRLEQRFAHVPNITVISPEDLKALPPECFDLIAANSVVQYLSRGELEGSLAVWLLLLDPAGHLVVADVIPPEVGVVSDLKALFVMPSRMGSFSPRSLAWRAPRPRLIATCAQGLA